MTMLRALELDLAFTLILDLFDDDAFLLR